MSEGLSLLIALALAATLATVLAWQRVGRMRQRLRASREALRAVFRAAPVPLGYSRQLHQTRVASHWNDAWYRAFGYSRETAEGRSGVEFGLWVDPAVRDAYRDRLLRETRVREFPALLRHADGSQRWYEVCGEIIDTPDGPLLISAFNDVTPVREAVATSQALLERLQAVFDASPVAMIVSDVGRGHKAVAANAAWYRQFKRTPEQVIGRDGLEIGLWADAVARQRMLGQLRQPGDVVEGFEAEMVRGDGTRLLGRMAARRFRAGDDDLMVTVQDDITERVRAAQALRESQEMLARTFELMPEPLSIIDGENGRFLDVNRRWVERIGLGREQAIGRTSLELGFWQDPLARTQIREALRREGQLRDVPVIYHLPGGELINCEVSASEVMTQGRRVELWMTRDVTESKRAQAQLRELNETLEARVLERTRELSDALDDLKRAQAELVRSEKLASLGSLVAGVAHELNTPIGNAVMVSSALADRRREFEAAIAGGLRRSTLESFLAHARDSEQVLQRNLERAAELVGSFKQLAVDQSSYQRRRFDLAEVVQEVLLALSPSLRRSGVTLTDAVPPGLQMDSYPGPLGQVLVNLITNALIHAFDEGAPGTIRLRAEATDAPGVRLRVADDGRGIAPAHLGRLFDPFFTTRLGQGGSGLGLHLVYTLVTGLLGGHVAVHSVPGQGAEFVIDLPECAPSAAPPPASGMS